jgi:hypothetical protein
MKKTILIAFCATSIGFAALLAAAEPATKVAIIDDIDGSVMVNTGEKFVGAVEGQSLKAGDRVMASKTGTATLVFNNDCRSEIKANTMVIIPERSICEGGVMTTQSVGLGATGTGNAGIYTLSAVALLIGAYEMSKSP